MDKYIPTTQEIREAFSKQAIPYAKDPYIPIVNKWFDRWLAEVKAQAWQEGWDTKPPYQGINNPYRQGEGSGNGASQSPVESSNLLNTGEEQ